VLHELLLDQDSLQPSFIPDLQHREYHWPSMLHGLLLRYRHLEPYSWL